MNVTNVSMNLQNVGTNIGLPQELILQDHLKYIIIALDDFSINVISLCMLYDVVWIWNIFKKLWSTQKLKPKRIGKYSTLG